MRSLSLFFALLFLLLLKANAQLSLTVGEKFLDGKAIKSVFVAVGDHSVWALTTDGKVFLKRQSELDFQVYQPTDQFVIDQITGFTENEMFFLLKPDIIIHFKAGVRYEIKVPFPGVTHINDISVLYTNATSTYYINNPTTVVPDYLVIATNKRLYKITRGDIAVLDEVPYTNQLLFNEPEWRMTNKGYKSVDFQYVFPESRYCLTANYSTINYIGNTTTYVSVLPDQAPAYSNVNCSLFALAWREYGSANAYNFWGNDKGLYVKKIFSCVDPIKEVIANETINDLEEIFALTPIVRQNFVMAATNNGLYYTPTSIFPELGGFTTVDRVKFMKHPVFPNEKIYSLCMDTKAESVIDVRSGWNVPSVCEKVLWVASSTGVRKVYATLDQDYYNDFKYDDFQYLGFPENPSDYTKLEFKSCTSQTITAKIPEVTKDEVLIQWYKDDVEITDWIGKLSVTMLETGKYKVKITVLCEGISLTSIPIYFTKLEGPDVTFAYPSEVNICNNRPYSMETKSSNDYSYQWYKDGVKIFGATQFKYSATTTGLYRVDVSSSICANTVVSSNNVKLNYINVPVPVINKDKTSYCVGEVASLSIDNPLNYQTKWYLDGTEINWAENLNKIEANQNGKYRVEFLSTDCANSSLDNIVTFNPLPTASVTRSSDKILCYGETVELSANEIAGATYLWNTGETTRNITVGEAGKYNVTITNIANCSLKSADVDVLVNEDLRFEKPLITSTKINYCVGEIATLNVQNVNGLKTKWYLNNVELTAFANQNQITTTTAGEYKVELINSLDCVKSSPAYQITFNEKLVVVIEASAQRTICYGESVKLSAGIFPNAKYLWSNGETTETINVKSSGKYSVQVFSEFNCMSVSNEVEVTVNPLPALTANERLKICVLLHETLKLQADPGFLYYTWNGNGGTGPDLIVNKPGTYTVLIEDINGCKASKTFEVVPYCSEIIAPNAFSPNGDGINDFWEVGGLENEPNATIKIFNRLGTLVFDGRGSSPRWDGNINHSPAPVGVYYYVITVRSMPKSVNGSITLIR